MIKYAAQSAGRRPPGRKFRAKPYAPVCAKGSPLCKGEPKQLDDSAAGETRRGKTPFAFNQPDFSN